MKLSKKITAGAVMTFVLVMAFLTVFGRGAEMPGLTAESLLDGTFGRELVSAAAEGFAGRDMWTAISAEISSRSGEPIVNGVYVNSSRLIDTESIGKDDGIAASADAINRLCEKLNGAVYFAPVPTSTGIYGDMLPKYLQTSTEKQAADKLWESLNTDIRRIDAYSILKMMSDNYIYYRTDTKWTSYGAYCVYRTVVQKLGFLPVSYDKYTIRHVTDKYRGDLYGRTKYTETRPDQLDVYEYDDGTEVTDCRAYDNHGADYSFSMYNMSAEKRADMYSLYLGEKQPMIKLGTTVSNDRQLLVIGDGFALNFVPFLTKHYNGITFIQPRYMQHDIEYFIDTDEYEQTLILFGMDTLKAGLEMR